MTWKELLKDTFKAWIWVWGMVIVFMLDMIFHFKKTADKLYNWLEANCF